jgi:Zn-dependent protease with chaperone function
VSAAVVQALITCWGVADPALRLTLRLLGLVLPPILGPGLTVLAPMRHEDWFVDGWALFARQHWASVEIGGVAVAPLVLGVAAVAGLGLFAGDAIRIRPGSRRGAAVAPPDAALEQLVAGLARGVRLPVPPAVLVFDTRAPILTAVGVVRPCLHLSTGLLADLTPAQLQTAVAHELAHLLHHDTRIGWLVMAARLAQCVNPAAQILARACVQEMEYRADADAARLTGDRDALCQALRTVAAGEGGRPLHAARHRWIAERCRRLQRPPDPEPVWGRTKAVLALSAVAFLLFFTV